MQNLSMVDVQKLAQDIINDIAAQERRCQGIIEGVQLLFDSLVARFAPPTPTSPPDAETPPVAAAEPTSGG